VGNLSVVPPEQHVQIDLLHGLCSQPQYLGMLTLKAFLCFCCVLVLYSQLLREEGFCGHCGLPLNDPVRLDVHVSYLGYAS